MTIAVLCAGALSCRKKKITIFPQNEPNACNYFIDAIYNTNDFECYRYYFPEFHNYLDINNNFRMVASKLMEHTVYFVQNGL